MSREQIGKIVGQLEAEMRAAAEEEAPESRPTAKPSERVAARKAGERRGRRAIAAGEVPGLEVTSVTVMPADEAHDGDGEEPPEGTAADWLPGIKDEHEGDDTGWMARWLDRPTWDTRVKRTGERPRLGQGRRRYR